MHSSTLVRMLIGGLALYGAVAAFSISERHMSGVEDCPFLGPVPACYVVLAGYSVMLLSVLRPMKWLFLVGWLPVFLLATAGVTSELFSDQPVCPRTAGGIPKCYFSFALSGTLGLLALCHSKLRLCAKQ